MIESPEQAYEFVQTGQWTFAEFSKWVTDSRTFVDSAYNDGYSDGYTKCNDEVYIGD
jgi:hypothetical protein